MSTIRKLSVALIAVCVSIIALLALCGCDLQGNDYKPTLKSPELKPPTILQDGTLRVGVNTSNSPLAGVSGDKIIGIDVDVAGAIGDNLGLEVDMRDVGSDGVDAIKNGNVDIVLGIDSDSTDTDMWISSEYIPTGIVIFALASSNKSAPVAGDNAKIGAQISSKSAWAITNSFGEKNLVSEADLASAFQALETGEVDFVAADAIIGLYAANRQNVPVKMVEVIGATTGYSVMASKTNTDLSSAVTQAINGMVEDGVIDVIEQKWLNSDVELKELPNLTSKKGKTS